MYVRRTYLYDLETMAQSMKESQSASLWSKELNGQRSPQKVVVVITEGYKGIMISDSLDPTVVH